MGCRGGRRTASLWRGGRVGARVESPCADRFDRGRSEESGKRLLDGDRSVVPVRDEVAVGSRVRWALGSGSRHAGDLADDGYAFGTRCVAAALGEGPRRPTSERDVVVV